MSTLLVTGLPCLWVAAQTTFLFSTRMLYLFLTLSSFFFRAPDWEGFFSETVCEVWSVPTEV